jgi:hypothetical protein
MGGTNESVVKPVAGIPAATPTPSVAPPAVSATPTPAVPVEQVASMPPGPLLDSLAPVSLDDIQTWAHGRALRNAKPNEIWSMASEVLRSRSNKAAVKSSFSDEFVEKMINGTQTFEFGQVGDILTGFAKEILEYRRIPPKRIMNDFEILTQFMKYSPEEAQRVLQFKKLRDQPKQVQKIRQHVSGGEVHFHDDEAKLKVAIPVADWWTIKREMASLNPVTWVDQKQQTILEITPVLENSVMDVVISINKFTTGDALAKLNNLA